MDSLIWFLIIFGLFNTLTSSSKKKQQEAKKQRQYEMPPQPVYREQPQAPRRQPPAYNEHPYAPETSVPLPQVKPVPKPKPVVQMKPKVKPLVQQMSTNISLEGQSLEGQSMEGLPLEYNIGTIQKQSAALPAEAAAVFSREDIIKGIVMSEILDKPKALRR